METSLGFRIVQAFKRAWKPPYLKVGLITLLLWSCLFVSCCVYWKLPYQWLVYNAQSPWHAVTGQSFPQRGVRTVDFVNSNYGWLAGNNGTIYTTTDCGQTWTRHFSGGNGTINKIDFLNPQIGVALDEITPEYVRISQNGGLNWTILEMEYSAWDVVICDNQTAWVLGSRGRFFRLDIPNQELVLVANPSLPLFRLFMLNTTHGWAIGELGIIIRTQDGWQTYENQTSGVNLALRGVFFLNPKLGWIVGHNNLIMRTTDGGNHWQLQYSRQPLMGLISLYSIFFITPLRGWAAGFAGIHYTANGGQTWVIIPNTSGPSHISFANETHGWAIGCCKDSCYRTTVGGVLDIKEDLVNIQFGLVSFIIIFTPVLLVLGLYYFRQRRPV